MQKTHVSFINSKILILQRSQLILAILCFVQEHTGTTLMHSPTALTRPLLTSWTSMPRSKRGLPLRYLKDSNAVAHSVDTGSET